jgi:N-acetylmuramoyl-L-alanine amidase
MLILLALLTLLGAAGFFLESRFLPAHTVYYSEQRFLPVIDAGHGGEDGGSSSRSGVWESRLNLEIARKLDLLMRFLGLKTVMTREEDISLHDPGKATLREKKVSDLKNRAAKINSVPNGALLSIHQNFYPESRYSGAQVFYRGDTNAPFAKTMQLALRRVLNPDNKREAKSTGAVYILNQCGIPAVLVECGFLSNAAEEARLRDEGYQRKVAMAVCEGFLQWAAGN